MKRQRGLWKTLTLVLLLAMVVQPSHSIDRLNKQQRAQVAELPAEWQEWVSKVRLLITEDELEAFLELGKDYQRKAFVDEFWRQRDPYPSTARNEFRTRWERRVENTLLEFEDFDDPRATIYLLNGQPAGRIESKCTPLWPLEIWFYQGRQPEGPGFDMVLIFYTRFGSDYRLWDPGEGLTTLTKFMGNQSAPVRILQEIESSCLDSDTIIGAINFLMRGGPMDFQLKMAEMQEARHPPESGEWVATFNSASTDIPEGATMFPARFEVTFPGRFQTRTVVQTSVYIDTTEIGLADLGDANSYNFVLVGEILRDDELFDTFHYQFNVPESSVQSTEIPLLFERKVRPGDYKVIVKLEDLNTGKIFHTIKDVEVPFVAGLAPTMPDDPETARMLAEANAAINTGDNTVSIVSPVTEGSVLAGLVRINTLAAGPDIDSVEFSFDGKTLFRKRTPPYSVELDLGDLPRMRTLTAVAYDAAGVEVARDEMVLNSGSHRFEIRLIEPRSGNSYGNSVRATADVIVPDGRSVSKVEFYLNETLHATLFQPPWEHPMILPEGGAEGYVRAVAYQPDGNSTEDLVFINAPDYLEEVDVQFVELYVTVTDKQKRPVTGLSESDFMVLEDGTAQVPVRFDMVSNLPIHAGILVDVSASMEPNLAVAKQAALGFFENTIGPEDRATLITFNDHPNLAVKFTNEIKDLAGGLAGLKAARGTSLYDSVIFSLYYFNGVKGQRALILLSDGKDESSRFNYENTLDYARRAGVAIYAIGLQFKKADRASKKKLEGLARETGGQSYFIDSVDDLASIYEQIEYELRSRYYLAYQSSNTAEDETFRSIEVRVSESGLEAKTLRGYYP